MSCLRPPADGPRPKPVPDSTGHYTSIQDLEASGERDSFKKILVVIPILTNLLTIGQKPTPVRPIISNNCMKYKKEV